MLDRLHASCIRLALAIIGFVFVVAVIVVLSQVLGCQSLETTLGNAFKTGMEGAVDRVADRLGPMVAPSAGQPPPTQTPGVGGQPALTIGDGILTTVVAVGTWAGIWHRKRYHKANGK